MCFLGTDVIIYTGLYIFNDSESHIKKKKIITRKKGKLKIHIAWLKPWTKKSSAAAVASRLLLDLRFKRATTASLEVECQVSRGLEM